jgi:hypothetical protein
MGAAEPRKQARDDVGENGCCHDLTATNELSRVYWPSMPDQVSPIISAAKPSAERNRNRERHRVRRGSFRHEKLRPVDATAPRLANSPSSLRTASKIKETRSP